MNPYVRLGLVAVVAASLGAGGYALISEATEEVDSASESRLDKAAAIAAAEFPHDPKGEPFDIVDLFTRHQAQVQNIRLASDDFAVPHSVTEESDAKKLLEEVPQGPNFGGKYRIIELPGEESDIRAYIVDLEAKEGTWLPFGSGIGVNLLYIPDSTALLEAKTVYPAADRCEVTGWTFEHREWINHGTQTLNLSPDGDCNIESLAKLG